MHHSGSIGGLSRTALGTLGVPANTALGPTTPPADWQAAWSVPQYFPDVSLNRHATGAVAAMDKTPAEVFDLFSTARSAPANVYYVSVAGGDGNAGTQQAPFRSIWKAVEAANASGAPATVMVEGGEYGKPYNPSQFNALRPSVDIAFLAVDGRVTVGTWDDFAAPSPDAIHANCYAYALTNVARVIDRTRRDADGFHPDLIRVADAATCNRIPGTWTLETGRIYVNRADGAAVTNANTRVLRRAGAVWRFDAPVSVYIGAADAFSAFDCQGSSGAAGFHYQPITVPGAMKAVVVERATFAYGADDESAGSNGVLLHGLHGLAVFADCDASHNRKDGFGLAGGVAGSASHMMTVNCRAVRCGGGTATSCNALTLHDNGVAVDFAGEFGRTMGGAVRTVGNSRLWLAGTQVRDDFGDATVGGNTDPAAIMAGDTSHIWASRADVIMPPAHPQFYASSDAEIALNNMPPMRTAQGGSGVVSDW